MGPAALQNALAHHQYYADRELTRKISACLSIKPVKGAFLLGPPGAGKSYLPEALAPVLGAEIVFYQVFPGLREEDLLTKLVPDPLAPSGIRSEEGPVTEATRISAEKAVVLVLDEWDKARPSADSFLLDWLQSGRVRYNGQRIVANQVNLYVFLTSNEERELSEPLLRRLPRIDIPVLPPAVVQLALNYSHPEHPHLANALILYQRTLLAKMRKPATIQELRQFLDAITALGPEADWNALVFQMITKSMDDHAALKAVEGNKNLPPVTAIPALDPRAFAQPGQVAAQTQMEPAQLPRSLAITAAGPLSPELSFGLLHYTDATYDAVIRGLTNLISPGPNDATLPGLGHVVAAKDGTRYLSFDRALSYNEFLKLENVQGEVLVTLMPQSLERLRHWLMNYPEWQIVRWSATEITAKNPEVGAEMRWTPGSLEVIWPKGPHDPAFQDYFGQLAVRKAKNRGVCTMKRVYLGKSGDGEKLYAAYTVQRLRRAAPSEGNVYFVSGTLFLPIANQNEGTRDVALHADLWWGRKITVNGEYLGPGWGSTSQRDGLFWRKSDNVQEAKAGSWPETHALVHAIIRREILKIVTALRERNKVHAKAEVGA